MKNFKKRYLAVVFFCISSVALVAAVQQSDIYFLIKKNFSIYSKAYEYVALEYVDEVNPEFLMRNGLNAMLATLDPYTVFIDESQNEQAEILSRGNYAGIGIEAGFRDGKIVVIAPIEGGPADQKGIRAGDEIVAVDSISTEGLSPEEVRGLTLGETGTSVLLKIKRFGSNQLLEFELERERIEVKNIGFTGLIGSENKIAYIKLNQFGMRSSDEIRSAISNFKSKGNLSGMIIDLRDNPGGILQESVRIVDKFIGPDIEVVETRGRKTEFNQIYKTKEPVLYDQPLVILMNQGSASASEVTAGALQDLDRAVIVGERSFGKGLVQVIHPLPYNTSIKITISRYYTPSGRSIQSRKYMHTGKNTPVVKADSISRDFKTKNGRTVFEGRGIEPDVQIAADTLTYLQAALIRQGVIFDFATKYYSQNQQKKFEEVSEQVYEEFLRFLEEIKFNYTIPAEELAEQMQAEIKKGEKASKILQTLKAAIETGKNNQLVAEKEALKKLLFKELIKRYNGQGESTRMILNRDPQVLQAVQLLESPKEYNAILNPEQ